MQVKANLGRCCIFQTFWSLNQWMILARPRGAFAPKNWPIRTIKGPWRALSVQGSHHIFHFLWYHPNENSYWLYFCILCNKNGIKGLWGDKGWPSLGPGPPHRMQKYSQYIKGHVWCIVGPWPGPLKDQGGSLTQWGWSFVSPESLDPIFVA